MQAKRVVIGGLALVYTACSPAAEANFDPKAKAVIERSQRTTASYAQFAWNDVPDDGEIKDGWSAEFHRGNLHRVETPFVRVIADCKEMIGTRLSVLTGEKITDPSVAKAACGINANFQIHSAKWLGRHETKFGMAERVTAEESIRTYEVLDSGALVTSVYQGHDGRQLVNNWSLAISPSAPSDIFSELSLERTAVPAEFRRAPDTKE